MTDGVSDPIRVGPVRTPERRGDRRRDVSAARVLRVVLPLAALALVAGIFLTARGGFHDSYAVAVDAAKLAAGSKVDNPRVTGVTADGAAYVLRAAEARPDGANPSRVELDRIRAEIAFEAGRTVVLTARDGVLTRDDAKVALSGGVMISTSDGYEVETDSVDADTEARTAASRGRVFGQGPAGRICAERLALREGGGGAAFFDGGVVVLLTDLPGAEASAAAPADPSVDCERPSWVLERP